MWQVWRIACQIIRDFFRIKEHRKSSDNKATCQLATKQQISSSTHLLPFKWHISNWWCCKSFTPFSSKPFSKKWYSFSDPGIRTSLFLKSKRFLETSKNVFGTGFYKWLYHFRLKYAKASKHIKLWIYGALSR